MKTTLLVKVLKPSMGTLGVLFSGLVAYRDPALSANATEPEELPNPLLARCMELLCYAA
jgi:hypothetical protein